MDQFRKMPHEFSNLQRNADSVMLDTRPLEEKDNEQVNGQNFVSAIMRLSHVCAD
jgi:hypothetical protein